MFRARYQFTHVACLRGRIAVKNALQDADTSIDERVVPWAVYTDPALAQVGMTEEQAADEQIEIVTASIGRRCRARSAGWQQAGLLKAIARRDSGELLGVSMVSPRADDLIHEATLAIRLRLCAGDIAETIHAYPTFSQGLEDLMKQLAEKRVARLRTTDHSLDMEIAICIKETAYV